MDMGNIGSLVCLGIGTIVFIIFAVSLLKGNKYDSLLEPLDGDDYPMKAIYSAGLALQESSLFQLRGALGEKLRGNATLCYGPKYSEYYARIVWAQVLSFAMLSISVMFPLAGMSGGSGTFMFAAIGIVIAIVFGYYFINKLNDVITTRRDACEEEFPNAISKLALLVNSGVILHNAWEMVAEGKPGVFYDLMRDSCEEMRNGVSDIDALYTFGVRSNSDDIKKFTTALIQSIERGGGELPAFLANQSSELWALKRQTLLQKGEKAASALLMPIALMFGGVMLIVIASAIQSFSL